MRFDKIKRRIILDLVEIVIFLLCIISVVSFIIILLANFQLTEVLNGIEIAVFPLCVFSVILVIVSLSGGLSKKLGQKPLWIRTSIAFGITHSIAATIAAVYVWVSPKNDLGSGMVWIFFIYGDFPVSFLIWSLDEVLSNVLVNYKTTFLLNNLIMPYFLFVTLGSFQYCIFGGIIGKIFEKIEICLPTFSPK